MSKWVCGSRVWQRTNMNAKGQHEAETSVTGGDTVGAEWLRD